MLLLHREGKKRNILTLTEEEQKMQSYWIEVGAGVLSVKEGVIWVDLQIPSAKSLLETYSKVKPF